ncbi:argininosuccinate lyase [Humisphaera borealis]|uniref:Argininosuccinate lyase n=1 Tax=Humisphaera borealis TaxID=2807512 RepID=A0A7M2WPL7_9BACT|nr:argininosuccinate lyase [Humisphaera borealis]QOV87406.1 argininosuccinate lyase [Humisphaera borealis]
MSTQPSSPAKSWQARISEATDSIAQAFVESVSYDWRLYKQDVAGSICHAHMLSAVGLLPDEDREAIIGGLREIEAEIDRQKQNWPGFKPEFEDIHMCVEAELIKRVGEAGRKLHTGRSRNDQVATDLMLWTIFATKELGELYANVLKAFVAMADRSADIVMPSYTHLQRAQPIAAGAEVLAWTEALSRGYERLARFAANYEFPLGAGAIAGSSLPLDRKQTLWFAKRFGILAEDTNRLAMSSIDATATRDVAQEFVFGLAMISQTLSRWAEQWILYMSTEFGFIKIADRYTTSSSMMPQKRNPDMLELIRGRSANVYGDLFAMMTLLKGIPIGYNRDLQEDKRILFRAYDTVTQCLIMAAAIIDSASFDKSRIEPTLDRGFLDATSLAEYLVTQKVPFRTAHHIVGTLVATCEKSGRHALAQLKLEEINAVVASLQPGAALTDDVYTALGAANVVKRYQSTGAAGGKPFQEQLAAWKKRAGL